MNKNIKFAVAGAVLALSATAANAGIVIPAGDWTLDVSGNVNMYTSWTKATSGSTNYISGGLTNSTTKTQNTMGNGLLPNFLSFSGSTRQNDLDVSFTVSLQPGSANNAALQQVGSANNTQGGLNNRQSFITFGDKSWGSVKIGKDLGIFASDAILNDMTLLGVGAGSAGSAGNTSLGRIGAGYIYADWKPQISYTTPNFSGFQATAGISQAFKSSGAAHSYAGYPTDDQGYGSSGTNASVAYEGKASYSFAANDVTGKVWVSGIAQHVGDIDETSTVVASPSIYYSYGSRNGYSNNDPMAYAADIGGNVKVAGFDLTGYYYYGSGVGTTGQMLNGYGFNDAQLHAGGGHAFGSRDSYGGYVQAIYTLPIKTRVGISWGESRLDLADGESTTSDYNSSGLVKKNEMWTAMIMHPLTKHLNLVAEWDYTKSTNQVGEENSANTGSLGAILFF